VTERFLRIDEICGDRRAGIAPLVPIAKSTLWDWVKRGKFPQPIKLSNRVTVWRSSDIEAFIGGAGNDAA
jgi:prophage regulatory protein